MPGTPLVCMKIVRVVVMGRGRKRQAELWPARDPVPSLGRPGPEAGRTRRFVGCPQSSTYGDRNTMFRMARVCRRPGSSPPVLSVRRKCGHLCCRHIGQATPVAPSPIGWHRAGCIDCPHPAKSSPYADEWFAGSGTPSARQATPVHLRTCRGELSQPSVPSAYPGPCMTGQSVLPRKFGVYR